MNTDPDIERLAFLMELAEREGRHLRATAGRLLPEPVTAAWVAALETDADRAERVDAFVARFARMQDTIGDRPRAVPQGGRVHASVAERRAAMDYDPAVLPSDYRRVGNANTHGSSRRSVMPHRNAIANRTERRVRPGRMHR